MADNDWINGYLEAILDTEGSAVAKQAPEKGKKDSKSDGKEAAKKEDSLAVPFFVKQITGFDETDLHRTWMKVCMHLHIVFRTVCTLSLCLTKDTGI